MLLATPDRICWMLRFQIQFLYSEVRLRIGFPGYVKLDYIQDFDGSYDRFQYEIQNVPVVGDGRPEQSGYMNMHARESRFGVDIRSVYGKWHAGSGIF
jgi:hypothetical protein